MSDRVRREVDHLFRRSFGRMVATLTRHFGPENLDLVEDVVQDSLIRALRSWAFKGIPKHPEGWLLQVARRRAIDVLRRSARLERHKEAIRRWSEEPPVAELPNEGIREDVLRMMFTCCHPDIPADARVALTLKTVGGFGVGEIARAFLTREATVYQRLARARTRIQSRGIPFAVPEPEELGDRLESVLNVLYLMFNEGYLASRGADLIREDMANEALRLGGELLRYAPTSMPKVHALMALMSFLHARAKARTDDEGDLLLLADQDRGRWDRGAIARGFAYLEQSARGEESSDFHLQAGIAACHVAAEDFESTDWSRILELYDRLLARNPSPVIALNRAVAVAMVQGAEQGLAACDSIPDQSTMSGYYLLAATKGELLRRAGRHSEAVRSFREALDLASSDPERRFLGRRIRECEPVD